MPEDKPHNHTHSKPEPQVADAGLLFPRWFASADQDLRSRLAGRISVGLRERCSTWLTLPTGEPTGRLRSFLLRRAHAHRLRQAVKRAATASLNRPPEMLFSTRKT